MQGFKMAEQIITNLVHINPTSQMVEQNKGKNMSQDSVLVSIPVRQMVPLFPAYLKGLPGDPKENEWE